MFFKSKLLAQIALAGFVLLANSQLVLAHDVIPGVSGFAGRVLHPFIITEHMLCLILAGFIAGLYGPLSLWKSLGILVAGLLVGFTSQLIIPIIDVIWMLPLASAVLAGLLVLSAPPLAIRVWLAIIFALGFAVGLETDPEGAFVIDWVQTLAGLMVAGALLLVLLGWPLGNASQSWVGIVARVVSSWIVAIAVLVLALNFN